MASNIFESPSMYGLTGSLAKLSAFRALVVGENDQKIIINFTLVDFGVFNSSVWLYA